MIIRIKLIIASILLIILCSTAYAGPKNVLVVINNNSADSSAVGKYYAAKRDIASKYICKISCPTSEIIKDEIFEKSIRTPIKEYLTEKNLKGSIDYIVLTKGVPIKTEANWGVDSALTCIFEDYNSPQPNPYFDAKDKFSHKKYQMYLVTRLDGLNISDAKALVDRSLEASARKGLFLIDVAPWWDTQQNYKFMNDAMRRAANVLKTKGYNVDLDDGPDFAVKTGLMGYFSWGSNDGRYTDDAFKKLKFVPGSIAELAQSTSAYTLTSNRTLGGKRSYITDLVAQGVTGVKGYVYEPFLPAIAVADILFDRYTSGANLAESFYASSKYIHWRDLILGDPLCAPYKK